MNCWQMTDRVVVFDYLSRFLILVKNYSDPSHESEYFSDPTIQRAQDLEYEISS